MGQYYKIANIDANEYLNPHAFNDGAKLMEFGSSAYGVLSAMVLMLFASAEARGPWAGSRIVVTGDYADEGRFVPAELADRNLYDYCYDEDGPYTNVSAQAKELGKACLEPMHRFLGGRVNQKLVETLFDDAMVIETADELFALFEVRVKEQLSLSIEEIQRVIRCEGIVSAIAWQHSISYLGIVKDVEGEVQELQVCYRRAADGMDVHKQLTFPAHTQAVREFFEITSVGK